MRRINITLLFLIATIYHAHGQTKEVDRKSFFKDERAVEVTLTTDIKELIRNKKNPVFQPAKIALKMPDSSTVIQEDIEVRQRGVFRKENCSMAGLMLNFKTPGSPRLSSLKKLKFVGACGRLLTDEQILLKEYLAYKLYNLFTEMSFRVRLLKVKYMDSKEKVKPYTQYAFVIEDVDDMAKRNGCLEKEGILFSTESTSRDQTTLVGIFQFMIANTDWSVPNYHNIKLMVPKNDTFALPYVIPYDFDCSGFVNASYAVPTQGLGLENVTERNYRGFPRTMEEIQAVANLFIEKREQVLAIITNFSLSDAKQKREMISFIESFYEEIGNKRYLQANFMENVRKK